MKGELEEFLLHSNKMEAWAGLIMWNVILLKESAGLSVFMPLQGICKCFSCRDGDLSQRSESYASKSMAQLV